jgi:hypothetical protein
MKKQILILAMMTFNGVAFATDYPNCKNETKTTPDNDPYNKMVLDAARSMPRRKGYDATNDVDVIENLKSSITIKNDKIHVDADKAGVSFCTSGTYMAFLKVVEKSGTALSTEATKALLVSSKKDQPDGVGVWGRWNADGPGPQYLFQELKLGTNFSDVNQAHPGDFMTIDWQAGNSHSTIFDSIETCNGEKAICFWASSYYNDSIEPGDGKPAKGEKPDPSTQGWDLRCSPASQIKNFYFGRLTSLSNLNDVSRVMGKDTNNYASKSLAADPKTNKIPRMSPAQQAALLYGTAGVQTVSGARVAN